MDRMHTLSYRYRLVLGGSETDQTFMYSDVR